MTQKRTHVLIIGSQGRLAGSLIDRWSKFYEVKGLSRSDLDVCDLDAIERILDQHPFDVLVNGSGLTNVDRCESAQHEAQQVNAIAPGVMARCASQRGARFIHFSTDYVFDGAKREPYSEEDATRPLGVYGTTKLQGEQRVLECNSMHMVVRVSWVFGPAKPSFAESLIERAMREDHVGAIEDKFSCPTSADDAAVWLEYFLNFEAPGGIYHACNPGGCSWQEYGAKALEFAAEAGLRLRTQRVEPIRLSDMKQFIAPRPVYSMLCTRKLAATTGIEPRHWHEALRAHIFKKYAPLPPAS